MITLRDYQANLRNELYAEWQDGRLAVVLVAPTGSGKTVVLSAIVLDLTAPSCVIAHRQELVGQISMALANVGVDHNIIASANTVKFCINQHIAKHGRSFYKPRAMATVASVDTLLSRKDKLVQWANAIAFWAIDECHHVLPDNKWGKAISLFGQARGVGFTATPVRADRKSLSVTQGGQFDAMVVGPSMRELIDEGSLADYRIFAPPQSINADAIKVSKATGDYSSPSLRQAAHESKIVGDIVQHYRRIAMGKRGITFVVDVEQATGVAKAFRDAGIPAESVSAKTPDNVRAMIIDKFVRGKLLQIVNVDLFGEGFDVPAVEVVSMGRPTQSYGLYVQQFGRGLRPAEGKTHGIIIDHVGNVKRHGLPDAVRNWQLESEERGRREIRDPDVMPVTTCTSCFAAYEAVTAVCPYCGHRSEPAARSGPEFVDGDLIELDPSVLAAMRGAIDDIDAPCPIKIVDGRSKVMSDHWTARQATQKELRDSIALWAGWQKAKGRGDSEIYRRFYHTFGTDVMTAQTLGTPEARTLREKILEKLG